MATNYDDFIAIKTRFKELFPATVPVVLTNAKNTSEPTVPWCHLSIDPGSSTSATLVTPTYLQKGRIYLEIFVPAQMGDKPGWDIAEIFTAIFREWRSDDGRLRCKTPEFTTSDAEPEYFMIRCSIAYEAWH